MGAKFFDNFGSGADAKAAFDAVTERAAWEHGHGGYTGTIAEKYEFEIRADGRAMTLAEAEAFADVDADDNDKWGPAFAVRVIDPERRLDGWLFYGYASS